LPSLRPETVYVGVSAGSIAMASRFGETYFDPPRCSGERLSSEDIVFARPEEEITMTLVMAEGVGLVDFAIIPHVEYDDHHDVANAEKWAGRLPVPTYAIDDATAVKVIDGTVEVVSEEVPAIAVLIDLAPSYRGLSVRNRRMLIAMMGTTAMSRITAMALP